MDKDLEGKCLTDLSKEELLRALKVYVDNLVPTNKIAVTDVLVESNVASLREVEETINRLIKKHKEFINERQLKLAQERNMFG